jgi:hypothetical protein
VKLQPEIQYGSSTKFGLITYKKPKIIYENKGVLTCSNKIMRCMCILVYVGGGGGGLEHVPVGVRIERRSPCILSIV